MDAGICFFFHYAGPLPRDLGLPPSFSQLDVDGSGWRSYANSGRSVLDRNGVVCTMVFLLGGGRLVNLARPVIDRVRPRSVPFTEGEEHALPLSQ